MAKPKALIEAGGIRALARSMRIMEDKELSNEMRAASKAAAEKIVPYAKAAVPVKTGALRASIKADATQRYGRIIAGTPTKVDYARLVHRGHFMGSGGRGRKYPGVKYLSKSIPKAFPQIIDEYVKSMNRIAKAFEKKHGVSRVYGRYK